MGIGVASLRKLTFLYPQSFDMKIFWYACFGKGLFSWGHHTHAFWLIWECFKAASKAEFIFEWNLNVLGKNQSGIIKIYLSVFILQIHCIHKLCTHGYLSKVTRRNLVKLEYTLDNKYIFTTTLRIVSVFYQDSM